jgi:hypothetical protein
MDIPTSLGKPINAIARSETTCLRVMHRQAKQYKLTLVGLLHFVRNDMVSPSLQFPPACGGKVKGYFFFVQFVLIREIKDKKISLSLCEICYSSPSLSAGV